MSSQNSLLSLPHDVLLIILQSDSLGARELCHLESCNVALRRMVDDELWKQTFLHQRHCNALREPDNWKKEFARRSSWSHGWRQLVAATSPCVQQMRFSGVQTHTQKLRRFAMKMVSGGSVCVSPLPKLDTHVVDPTEPTCFATIGSALAHARPFDRVSVRGLQLLLLLDQMSKHARALELRAKV